MALPFRDHRITKPDFRHLLDLSVSHSQAPLCLYTLRLISNQPEGNLCAPPLLFGRRPPQSNCPPDTVPPDSRAVWLETKQKGGISTLAPPTQKPRLQSLPPILHIRKNQNNVQAAVKVHGVFPSRAGNRHLHRNSISPSSLSRQCSSRYAIRAGRNLPDKEFRYLRTVIVTAAVYWGFGSSFACADLSS